MLNSRTRLPDVILFDTTKRRLVCVDVATGNRLITRTRIRSLELEFRPLYGDVLLVTAFTARRDLTDLIGDLPWGTWAWFASEPRHVIRFR